MEEAKETLTWAASPRPISTMSRRQLESALSETRAALAKAQGELAAYQAAVVAGCEACAYAKELSDARCSEHGVGTLWLCACGYQNTAGVCTHCGRLKPTATEMMR